MGALPEYTSREGWGVEVPDRGNAASRHLGPLVIDGFHSQFASGALPWRVPAAAGMHPVLVFYVLDRVKKALKK